MIQKKSEKEIKQFLEGMIQSSSHEDYDRQMIREFSSMVSILLKTT